MKAGQTSYHSQALRASAATICSRRGRVIAGWAPEGIAEHAAPALKTAFMPLDTSEQAFPWDPV